MRKPARLKREEINKRKNFLPTLIITVIFWLAAFGTVNFIDPQTPFVIPLFFVLCFFTLCFTFSIILANSRRGLIISGASSFFLLLRYFGVGNIINLLIIVGLAITVEIYLSKK